jgi:thiamine pyrophosphokinase
MTHTTLIFTGGGEAPPDGPIPAHGSAIAADSGLHLAQRLGVSVDLVVGDLDSVRPEALDAATAAGTIVERHDADKDASDLELALEAARRRGGTRVVVIGGTGGDRLDHLLATAELLGSDRYADLEIEWWAGRSRAIVTRGSLSLDGHGGDLLSIIPVGGPITVSAEGVRWPLDTTEIEHGSTRALSNEITHPPASVTVSDGTAFVVHTEGSTP